MNSGQKFYTLAALSKLLTIRFDAILGLANSAGCKPAFHLNGLPYYLDDVIPVLEAAVLAHDRAAAAAGVEIRFIAGSDLRFPAGADSGPAIQASAAPSPLALTATAVIEAAAGAGKRPTFAIAAYSGGELRVSGYGWPVVVDLAGLRAGPGGRVTVLKDHSASQVVGQGTAKIDAKSVSVSGVVTGDIANPASAAGEVMAHHAGGFVWAASVGVLPEKTESVKAGAKATVNGREFSGPIYIVRAGRLGEVSFVAVGADESAVAQIAASAGKQNMENQNTIVAGTAGEVSPDVAVERTRVSGIQALHAEFGKCSEFGKISAQAVNEGWTVQAAELALLRANRTGVPNVITGTRGRSDDLVVLKAAAALHMAPGIAVTAYGAAACETASRMRIRSLHDLCAAAVTAELGYLPNSDSEMIRAAFSTASLANILADVASKEALQQYLAAPSAWRSICRKVSVRDFKVHNMVRLLLAGGFSQVAPSGELKHHSASDEKFTIQADTYGSMFGLTRKDVVNDDSGALMDTARIIGRKGAQYVNKMFAQAILGNAGGFFAAGNGNYTTGADTALSVAALLVALTNLRNRKDADGENLDIAGTTLLVPPNLELSARQILKSAELARYVSSTKDLLPTSNPVEGILTLAVEPRLENTSYAGASALAWYIFSQPSDGAVVMAFLNGVETPTVEQEDAPFNMLGVMYRGFIDAGCALADPKPCYMAKGEV